MKFRQHCGGLSESMETQVTLKDRNELEGHCARLLSQINQTFDPQRLTVEPYDEGPDIRINWDATYIVIIKGFGPIGFTDSIC